MKVFLESLCGQSKMVDVMDETTIRSIQSLPYVCANTISDRDITERTFVRDRFLRFNKGLPVYVETENKEAENE